MTSTLRAPFPWFGGKSRVAHVVWERFGDVPNYVEPFYGSGAVHLARPHAPRTETVNDKDGYVANFWRAVQHAPEEVAQYADWPVNEADLHARHRWLLAERGKLYAALLSDPDFFDARIAGWWVWGLCAWIGTGWCTGGAATQLPHLTSDGIGVHRKIPDLANRGRGEVRPAPTEKIPHLSTAGTVNPRPGPSHQLPHLGNAGRGGHRVPSEQLPALADAARGVPMHAARSGLVDLMRELSDRLRRVRIACGDWSRVVTPAVTSRHGVTGVFLDPPYSHDEHEVVYATGREDVSAEVREWALANGDDPNLRIALCGYDGEHDIPSSWDCLAWKAHGGYGGGRGTQADENSYRERIWFSPHCLKPVVLQPTLFDVA